MFFNVVNHFVWFALVLKCWVFFVWNGVIFVTFPPPWSLVSRFVSAKINENAGMEDDLDENITFDNFDDDDEDDIDDI